MKKIFIGNHEVIIADRKEASVWKDVSSREKSPQLAWLPNIITERDMVLMESSFKSNKNPLTYFLLNESGKNLEEAILSIQGIVWQKDLPPFSKGRCMFNYSGVANANQD